MGGCSSKPQTSEREGNTPTNQELNLMLSGLKAIDQSNPSHYKGSQHTLQSLFIQHHRDGEDALENPQTLQELLQDSKALPNFENESAGNTERQLASKDVQQECKPSSPISVLADLAEQDAEKCKQTERPLLSQEVAQESTPAPSVLAGQVADHCASLEAADCKPHDAKLEPKSISDQLPSHSHEPNLSNSISAYPIFHDIRASKAMEMFAPDVRALDAEVMEAGINRHEQEGEGGHKSGEMAAESKIVKGPREEPGMEGTRILADLESEEAGKVLGAYNSEVQREEALKVMECEALLVVQPHEDNSADVCLESEKAALQGIEVKASEGEEAGLQAESVMEAEKLGGQDREHIENENAGVQIEEDKETVRDTRNHTEGEVEDKIVLYVSVRQEGEKEHLQDEDMACLQDAVTSTHVECAGSLDRSDKEGTTCAKKAGAVQNGEGEELDGGFRRNDETRMEAAHEGESLVFTQTDAREEPKLDQGKFTLMANNVQEAASEPTERFEFEAEKLEFIRSANEACRNDIATENIELEEKGSEGMEHIQKDEPPEQSVETIVASTRHAKLDDVPDIVKSLEKKSSQSTVSEEVVITERDEHEQQVPNAPAKVELNKEVHNQALELSSSEERKPVDAPFEQTLPEGNTIDNEEREEGVELEYDKSNGVDSKEKKEEFHDGCMEELKNELTQTGMVADALAERAVKDARPI